MKKRKKILESSQEFLNWLEANPDATEKEIEQKKKELLDDKIQEIISNAESRKDLEEYINKLREKMKDPEFLENLNENDKKIIGEEIQDLSKWYADNPNATKKRY